jgi:plastocyanin
MKRALFLGVILIMITAAFTSPVLASTIFVPLVATGGTISPLSVNTGPQTYTVLVGWDNGQQDAMINGFFPSTLTIHKGDTVKWVLNSMEIHTVTFLAGMDINDIPFIIPAPANPVGPLMLNPKAAFPNVPSGSSYDGSFYLNSGLIQDSGDPKNPTSYSLTFTQTGSFPYVCLVHGSLMSGTIVVVDSSTPIYTPAQVNRLAYTEIASFQPKIAAAITDAFKSEVAPVMNSDGTTNYTVEVGYSAGQVDLMNFFPNHLVVHPGDTVKWELAPTNDAPHTVTFLNGNPEPATFVPVPQGPNEPPLLVINGEILGPINANVDLNNMDIFHSGLMQPGTPLTSFTLKIGSQTETGTYDYFCMLHDTSGMLGTLQVTLP